MSKPHLIFPTTIVFMNGKDTVNISEIPFPPGAKILIKHHRELPVSFKNDLEVLGTDGYHPTVEVLDARFMTSNNPFDVQMDFMNLQEEARGYNALVLMFNVMDVVARYIGLLHANGIFTESPLPINNDEAVWQVTADGVRDITPVLE